MRSQNNPYNVYIPYTISPTRGLNLGMRAILRASRDRSLSSPFWANLSKEFIEASQGKGDVISKKYILNRLAGSNKRRAHLSIRRWSPFIS